MQEIFSRLNSFESPFRVEKAEQCTTTFLWEGKESYIDVNSFNTCAAPHNRVGALGRGLVPDLKRLTEDHGGAFLPVWIIGKMNLSYRRLIGLCYFLLKYMVILGYCQIESFLNWGEFLICIGSFQVYW